MRKREWMRSKDPQRMFNQVHGLSRPRGCRLLTLMAGTRIWAQLEEETCRRAIETAWRQAEGVASPEEIKQLFVALEPIYIQACGFDAWDVACAVQVIDQLLVNPRMAVWMLLDPRLPAGLPHPLLTPDEMANCCRLIRDIFGYAGTLPCIEHTLLIWNEGTVCRLARTIYEESDFSSLPILADALEEAGCADEAILSHCRGLDVPARLRPQEHVHGCWVLDALLAKEEGTNGAPGLSAEAPLPPVSEGESSGG